MGDDGEGGGGGASSRKTTQALKVMEKNFESFKNEGLPLKMAEM